MKLPINPLQLSLIVLLLCSWNTANAQILFTNGPVTVPTNSANGGANGGLDGLFSADTNSLDPDGRIAGNVFTPTLSGTAQTIEFGGAYLGGIFGVLPPPVTDDFTISLYATTLGTPSTLIASSSLPGVTRTAYDIRSFPEASTSELYTFSGTLATPFTLTAGTNYYLGISDTTQLTPQGGVGGSFYVDTSLQGHGPAASEYSSPGSGYFIADGNVPASIAFTLSEAPEPATVWSLIVGLGLVAFYRRSFRFRLSAK